LFGERLDAMRGCEEGGFDVVLVQKFEEPIQSDCRSIDASRYIGWILRRTITCVDPMKKV
jgi:hypothetical protein